MKSFVFKQSEIQRLLEKNMAKKNCEDEKKIRIWAPAEQKQEAFTWGIP